MLIQKVEKPLLWPPSLTGLLVFLLARLTTARGALATAKYLVPTYFQRPRRFRKFASSLQATLELGKPTTVQFFPRLLGIMASPTAGTKSITFLLHTRIP
ncbi:hypothetical protein F4801DRAFT_561449 [Xylaria longipes]|nr:hypothetical protein F4801DRAFT_561449 [Xylaria longipes]